MKKRKAALEKFSEEFKAAVVELGHLQATNRLKSELKPRQMSHRRSGDYLHSKESTMAYASRRFIRRALIQVIESEKTTPGDMLKAAQLLMNMMNLAPSRSCGKLKSRKSGVVAKSPKNGFDLDRLLQQVE